MSISNLFVSNNSYDLNCKSLTTNELTTTNLTTTSITTTSVTSDTITLNNQRTVPFQVYYVDGFGDFQVLPGLFDLTIIRVGNFLQIDFPDIDVNLPTVENAIVIANPGTTGTGPAILSLIENISHNYNFNFLLNIGGGNKEQAYINIPEGLDEAWTISKIDASTFTGAIELYGQSFVVKVV
jgi:hypothetical protein